MTLDCNHECKICPAWTLGGETSCLIINKILKKLDFQERVARQEWYNSIKEGENK